MELGVSNPFSTRFTQPGRIEPLDTSGNLVNLIGLVDRLQWLGGTATLVGPHGSGKSTLLVHLADAIERRGDRVTRVRLHSWRDGLAAWATIRRAAWGGVACIDSWECLGYSARVLLRLVARVSGCGLLVTSHHAAGLPVLARCDTTADLLQSIVGKLPDYGQWHGRLIQTGDIEEAFITHHGNLRESLCELYDRFEMRRHWQLTAGGDGSVGGDGGDGLWRGIHEIANGFS